MKLPRRAPAAVRAAVLVLAVAGLAAPQDIVPVSPQDRQAPAKPLRYELAVVLKLVPVHVTDKKGNPILDLTREEFTVADNGQPVTITEFERHALSPAAAAGGGDAGPGAAVEPAPASSPAVRPAARKFFLFFDFAYNNVRGILKARTAALHFLDTAVRAEDEVAVLTYSAVGGLAFHEYLTPDHAKVRRVVEKIGHADVKGRATEIEDSYWRLVQESGGSFALGFKAESEANRQESRGMALQYMQKMAALARALRLVDGEKSFILFSTGIPNSLIYGYASGNVFNRSDVGRASGDDALRRQNEAMYREFGASGCSFYAFDTRESAKEAALFTYDEETFAMGSRAMTTAIDPTFIFKDDKATGLNSLKRFSDLTGGKFYSNINMYEKNIGQVGDLTGTYYVLGYSVNEQWNGQFHEVKVEVRRKGCEVRAQTGYFDPKPYAQYSDLEKQIHLFDLALNERSFSRLPVSVPMTALASAAEGVSRLALLARLPGEVTARFAGRRVEFVALFFDAAGDLAGIVREERDLAPMRGREMAFAAGSALAPGDYGCRLVIRDMESGLSAVASAKAVLGRPQPAGLELGTPLVLEARAGCPLVCAAAGKGRDPFPWADLYDYDSSIYAPVLAGEAPAAAAGLTVVVPCAGPGGGTPADLAVKATLIDASNGRQTPVPVTISGRAPRGPLEVLTLGLATAGLAPGEYYLHLYAGDKASGSLGHAFTALSLR
ncbi:MAG: VWA domain-containing protein [Acidobacteriota bacterium]